MIAIAISFIAGISAFNFYAFFPYSFISLGVVSAVLLFMRFNANKGRVYLLIIVFLSGYFYALARHEGIPDLPLPESDVSLIGTIIDVPEISGDALRFTLNQVYLGKKKIQGRIRLAVYNDYCDGDLRGLSLSPGDRVSTIAKLRAPAALHNPGVFSYDLTKDGVVASGYAKKLRVTGFSKGFLTQIQRKRHTLGKIFDESLSDESASLLKGIIPGLSKGIGREMRDAFSATGLAHILSISGAHFGLLAFMTYTFIVTLLKFLSLKALRRMTLYITPSQIAVLLTLPVLISYALISGSSTPTIRSLITVCICMLAVFIGRKGQWLNSASAAAVVILLWQPAALFELSFVLSFLAVLSIGFTLDHIDRKSGGTMRHSKEESSINKFIRALKTAPLLTIAAVTGTAPVAALVFKQLSLISPLTNLIVTPLICFVILPAGFFAGFYALIFNMQIMPLSGLIDTITVFTLRLIELFNRVPYANIHIHNPSILMIILYYVSLALLLRPKGGSHLEMGNSQNTGSSAWRVLPFLLVMAVYLASPYPSRDKLKVTFLDVGQGDSSVVTLPDNKIMLIDGSTREPDMGRRVIAPYLWSRGIRKVDYMVLTHAHPDHYGGLMYILDNFNVGQIWLNKRYSAELNGFIQQINDKKINYKFPGRGDVLFEDKYKIYVFHPYNEFNSGSPRGQFSNQNNDSLVLKIEADDLSVLFTGDIEQEAEERLVSLGKWLRSDIIKAPHHGSRTSSSEKFIETVNPQIAVASAGRNNTFKHPHQETIKHYKTAGARFFRTDINGAVTISSNDGALTINTHADRTFKEVSGWKDETHNLKLLLQTF